MDNPDHKHSQINDYVVDSFISSTYNVYLFIIETVCKVNDREERNFTNSNYDRQHVSHACKARKTHHLASGLMICGWLIINVGLIHFSSRNSPTNCITSTHFPHCNLQSCKANVLRHTLNTLGAFQTMLLVRLALIIKILID